MTSIPASQIVSVIPNVLAAGGRALDLVGVVLTTSTRVPIGDVHAFATALDVGLYFGLSSAEKSLANVYFNGFFNSNMKPSRVYFAQYNEAAVAPYLRGGSLAGMTLTQLKALPAGTLTVTFNGTPSTSASIDLSGATSFSNAAALIEAAFTTPAFSVAYDSVSAAFVFTGDTAGATHTVAFASAGTMATNLKLTSATGAALSQGADAAAPESFMDGVVQATTNWATFMTAFNPDASGNDNKLLFAKWANAQGGRYGYVCWDTDTSPAASAPATGSLGYLIGENGANYSGTVLIGQDGVSATIDATYAAFVCGSAASIDFNQTNGRITFAFKRQTGLAATCTRATAAQNLIANGYNFYGSYATANDLFVWLYNGSVSGPFLWFDNYVDEIWLTNQLQLSLMVLLQETKSIPYNNYGYGLIEAACLDPIRRAKNFGAIRSGITLSEAQKAEVNGAAGIDIAATIYQQGWYLQVKDADPEVRQNRGSPPCTLWYTDGGSVHQINLTSVDIL